MKKIEHEKQESKVNEVPLATMVIREYKELNKTYVKTNKRLTIVIIFLLIILAAETTYIVLYWDSIHPHAGAIIKEINE